LDEKIKDLNRDFIDESKSDMPDYMLDLMRSQVQASGKTKDVFAFSKEQCPAGVAVAKPSDTAAQGIGKPYCIVLMDIPLETLVTRYAGIAAFSDNAKFEEFKSNYTKSKDVSGKLIGIYNEIKQFLTKDAKRRLVTALKYEIAQKMTLKKENQSLNPKKEQKHRILVSQAFHNLQRLKRISALPTKNHKPDRA
jgi:hypothetical protein